MLSKSIDNSNDKIALTNNVNSNYFEKSSDIKLTLISLTAMAEREEILLSNDDSYCLDSFLDDPLYYHQVIILLNKLSISDNNPFVETPFFIYDHLFQLLETNQSNIVFSTVGNFIGKSVEFAEYAIENDIIPIFINRYSNEQQDMVPWIAKCFLTHQKKSIVNNIYPLINNIMKNIGLLFISTETGQKSFYNYIILGFQALSQFISITQNSSYFIRHYCFFRNITMGVDNDECIYEKYFFVFLILKKLSIIPANFPYFSFCDQAKSDLLSSSEKSISIILKCFYIIAQKSNFIDELINCGMLDIFQEMLQYSSFKIKKIIVLMISELLTKNSITLQILDLLDLEFFDIMQDFICSFDKEKCIKLFNSFSSILDIISNDEQLEKVMQLLDYLHESQIGEIFYQIEQKNFEPE